MKTPRPTIAFALAAAVALAPTLSAQDSQLPVIRGAEVITGSVVPTVFEGDLRDLPPVPEWQPGDPIKEIPKVQSGAEAPLSENHVEDPLMDLQNSVPHTRGADFTIAINQDGQGFSGVNPPDTDGDVGTDYYIQVINFSSGTRFTIYDKADGSVAAGPTALDSLARATAPAASATRSCSTTSLPAVGF